MTQLYTITGDAQPQTGKSVNFQDWSQKDEKPHPAQGREDEAFRELLRGDQLVVVRVVAAALQGVRGAVERRGETLRGLRLGVHLGVVGVPIHQGRLEVADEVREGVRGLGGTATAGLGDGVGLRLNHDVLRLSLGRLFLPDDSTLHTSAS
jgi:hypothetical protein